MIKKSYSLLLILLALLLMNPLQSLAERMVLPGQYVTLDNGVEIWVSQYGEGTKDIVFFAGLGATSPTFEFIPMIEKINEMLPEYTVHVYEYPGTGNSKSTDIPRTIENITNEIDETMNKLGIERFISIAHSLSGTYMLYYSNQHPEKMEGIVCLDNSVPKQAEFWDYDLLHTYYEEDIVAMEKIDWDTATREEYPDYFYLPPMYEYSEEALALFKEYLKKTLNPTMMNEIKKMGENLVKAKELRFPDDIPLLMLLSNEKEEGPYDTAGWISMHEELITNQEKHGIIVVEGSHYLHYDAFEEILPLILEFLTGLT